MFAKKINCNPCSFLFHGYKLLIVALLAFGMVACDKSLEETPEPSSTFKIHIGESNIAIMNSKMPDYYPPLYNVVLVMEDLPADEKIIKMGSYYSTVNTVPDKNDYTNISDFSNEETFQEWDWSEPLYWSCAYLLYPLPNKTYYVRGYVQTNKGEYFSNVITINPNFNASIEENPDAYEIPVIFHLFPDSTGNYPVKEWMLREQLEYANYVYGSGFHIPGQTDSGVRFVAATQTPDGTPLSTPGFVYEKQPITLTNKKPIYIDDQYVWDMEKALNVWVAPIVPNTSASEDEAYEMPAAISNYLPFFDEDEKLEGCNTYSPGIVTGIFLNSDYASVANNTFAFAHEVGHFLGLYDIYENDFCNDTPWYDRTTYLQSPDLDLKYSRINGDTGEKFYSDNIMDEYYGYMSGLTPDQAKRIQYTLQHAYFIPGKAGKEEPASRVSRTPSHFGSHPVR